MSTDALPVSRRTLIALLLFAAVLSSGLWASGVAVTDSEPQVTANVSERYQSVESVSATRSVVVAQNDSTTRTVADVTLVPGTDRKRVQFRETGPHRNERRISNGSVLWLYDSDRERVTVINLTGPPTTGRAARLQAIVAAAGLTDAAGRPQQPDVAPLPTVPRRSSLQAAPAADGYRVQYIERDSIDGRDTFVVELSPATNRSETAYRQRIWLDSERFYPLRTQTVWRTDGVQRSVTTSYTNITFDAQVSADTFQPDFGADTSVERLQTPNTEWFRSVDRLKAESSIAVPDPTVPSPFRVTYTTRTTGRVHGVGLRYATEGSQLTIAKYNFTYAPDPGERDLTIGGRPATLDRGPTTSLSWTCDQYRYTVRGTGVETDQLITVARSVGCPTS
ncbi:outer membrane lipoprotein carrier protein LolA [Halobellus sp. Atlit-38R]|uniref:LolA family protein n=1 Tax=Halobellus sp. Atlit-38R TaxID=2282131 RepID=UPI000EF1D45B|nr:sigma-E factor regulatory protein RseB domain-containing protein [Halobellus sp. Atlit-38R]RLM84230.1 outer membrane lipoprotein carrier protein LolA [Halobellus sp. Atlit-38R]